MDERKNSLNFLSNLLPHCILSLDQTGSLLCFSSCLNSEGRVCCDDASAAVLSWVVRGWSDARGGLMRAVNHRTEWSSVRAAAAPAGVIRSPSAPAAKVRLRDWHGGLRYRNGGQLTERSDSEAGGEMRCRRGPPEAIGTG